MHSKLCLCISEKARKDRATPHRTPHRLLDREREQKPTGPGAGQPSQKHAAEESGLSKLTELAQRPERGPRATAHLFVTKRDAQHRQTQPPRVRQPEEQPPCCGRGLISRLWPAVCWLDNVHAGLGPWFPLPALTLETVVAFSPRQRPSRLNNA